MNSSNPTLTPAPNPAVHYDASGRPYVQDQAGQWIPFHPQPYGGPATMRPHDNNTDGPNEPLQQALTRTMPPPVAGSSRQAIDPGSASLPVAGPSRQVIDPALVPLPDDSDDDLSDGRTIAKARGLAPAAKVSGVRQKGKGKQRTAADKGKEKATSRKRKHVDDDEDEEAVGKRGRPKGAANYTVDEVDALLDLVEEELPQGGRGWTNIHRQYTRWARKNGKVERQSKSLESKYKQLVKVTKPTGDAYCPPDVKRAHKIDALICERSHTHEIHDSEFDDAEPAHDDDTSDDDEVEVVEPPPKKQAKGSTTKKELHDTIIRRPDPSISRRPRTNNTDIMGRLADAMDPAVLQARDDGRAQRSFQTSHIFTLSQQLRDANTTNETLHSQISTLQAQVHEGERALDRARTHLRIMEHMGERTRSRDHRHRRLGRSRRSESTKRSLQRVRGKTRVDEKFSDGGTYTHWVTDPSSDSNDDYDMYDNNKENIAPPFMSARTNHYAPSSSTFGRDSPRTTHSSASVKRSAGRAFGNVLAPMTTSSNSAEYPVSASYNNPTDGMAKNEEADARDDIYASEDGAEKPE